MPYSDGQALKLGGLVNLSGASGIIVAVVDTKEFSESFPEARWSYLERGFLAEFGKFGLIHFDHVDPDLELVRRADPAK